MIQEQHSFYPVLITSLRLLYEGNYANDEGVSALRF